MPEGASVDVQASRRTGVAGYWALTLLLVLVQAYFLWAYLVSMTVDQMAIAAPPAVRQAVHRFSGEWRHGTAPGWPLYVHGYFMLSYVGWWWLGRQPLRRIVVIGSAVIAAASVCAYALAPAGIGYLVAQLQARVGPMSLAPVRWPSALTTAVGVTTIAAWSVLLACGQHALRRRSPVPFACAGVFTVALVVLKGRAQAFGELSTHWRQGIVAGDPVAIVSLLFVPATVWLLVRWELRRERDSAA